MTTGMKKFFLVRKPVNIVAADADGLRFCHYEALMAPRDASLGQKKRLNRTPSGQKSSTKSFGRSVFRMQSRKLLYRLGIRLISMNSMTRTPRDSMSVTIF